MSLYNCKEFVNLRIQTDIRKMKFVAKVLSMKKYVSLYDTHAFYGCHSTHYKFNLIKNLP